MNYELHISMAVKIEDLLVKYQNIIFQITSSLWIIKSSHPFHRSEN